MDILFENQYTHSKDYLKELFRYAYFRRPVLLVANIAFAFVLLFVIFAAFRGVSLSTRNLRTFISWPILVWAVVFVQYMGRVKTRYKQEMEITNGKPLAVRMVVTSDGIEIHSNESKATTLITFQKIKRVGRTKNYLVLTTEANLLIAFKKEGFLIGTSDEFIFFLRGKGCKC